MYNTRIAALMAQIEKEKNILQLVRGAFQAEPCADELDLDFTFTNVQFATIMAKRAMERLKTLEALLEKARSHDAFLCAECGEPIPLERVLAAPESTLCRDCQELWERQKACESYVPPQHLHSRSRGGMAG